MSPPPDAVRRALAPLLDAPATTAVLTDFDGTLAPIVGDPAAARPLEGAPRLLSDLAGRFGVVAVISGRPLTFLQEHLPVDSPTSARAPRLVGLYGLERAGPDGRVTLDPAAEHWLATVRESAARLSAEAPAGVHVEPKGATLTLHWRGAPGAAGWAQAAVAEETARTSLLAFPGRMSVELRPPLGIDKGSVVEELARGCSAVCYFGDDLGDLPAFAALEDLGRARGVTSVSIAVTDDETPEEVVASADLTVPGPAAALAVLAWLAAEARGSPD